MHVPYIIKSYQDIVKDPKDTIVFDEELHNQIDRQKEDLGADGALLKTQKVMYITSICLKNFWQPFLPKCQTLFLRQGFG